MAQVIAFAKLRGWRVWHDNATNAPRRCSGCGQIRHLPRNESGLPDLLLVRRPDVLFVELKSDTGEPTEKQQEWLDDLLACGQRVFIWKPSDHEEMVRVLL